MNPGSANPGSTIPRATNPDAANPCATTPESRLPNPAAAHPAAPVYAALYALAAPRGALVSIAADFSPRYERHGDDLVVLDASGLDRLLGPPRVVAEELRRAAAARGIRVYVGVATTPSTAIVLAIARPGMTVVACGDEAAALAPVPIAILEKYLHIADVSGEAVKGQGSDFNVQTFTRWGLRTLGELAALPPADLVARCGRAARMWQAVARGDAGRPLVPAVPDERFESSLELEWPIEGLEPLSFVLTRLLEPLSTRLERRDRGAAVLHVILRLVTHDICARRLELPWPLRDVRTLRTLALLDLDAHPPEAAIDRVTIVIDPTPGRVLQHALFTRAHPTPEQLSTLLARLGALMGPDRFGTPVVVDSYRPGAFAMAAFATEHGAGGVRLRRYAASARQAGEAGPAGWGGVAGQPGGVGQAGRVGGETLEEQTARATPPVSAPVTPKLRSSEGGITSALRRCRHPVPARVAVDDGRPVRVTTDRRGFAGGAVVACAGPWRSSGNWWAGEAGVAREAGRLGEAGEKIPASSTHPPHSPYWHRDEWDVALNDRGVYRIFRDRDTDAWFIDAIVD